MVKLPRMRMPPPGWAKPVVLTSVRGRIIAGFGLLVVILVAVAAGSAWLHREHLSDMAEMEDHAATSSLLDDARIETTSAALTLQRYIITGDETEIPEFRSSVATALDSLNQAHAHLEDTGGRGGQIARLDRVLAVANPMAAGAEEIITMRQEGEIELAAAALEEIVPAYEQFALELQDIAEVERQQVASLRSQADRTGDLAFWLLVLSGALGSALALAASLATARSILKPLQSLESAALAVTGGDLEARAPTTGPRELVRLGASLNQMTESLLGASKRRELEEALHKLSRAVEQSPASVVITDLNGSIEYVNPGFTQLTGYTLEEVIGKNPRILKSGETPPEEYKRLWETITSGGEWRGEFHNKKKNGGLYWESASISPIRGQDGTITHFLGVKEDITERKRAEEALRESEVRHRTLLDNLPQKIFLKDTNSVYVSCNENYARDLNIRPDDIAGKTDDDFFPKELADKYRADDRRVMDSGKTEDIEEDYVQDGERVYVQTVKTPVRNENGDAVGVLGIFWDITARKQAEQALRESEERYRAVFEQATDSIALIDAATGALVQFNDRAHETLGYSREEFEKLKIPDFEVFESAEEVAKHMAKVLKEGADTFETKHKTKAGEILDIEVGATAISIGGRGLFQAIFRDVTERKRSEEALRESEERLRDFLDTATDLIQSVAPDGSILYVNRAWREALGYSQEEVHTLSLFDIIHPDSKAHCMEMFHRVMVGESSDHVEAMFMTKDGRCIWVEGSVFRRLQGGKPVATRGIFRDITERKRAEEALRESEEAFRQLFENAKDAIFWADPETGLITRCNRAAESLLEKERREIVGQPQGKIHPPEKAEYYAEMFRTHMEQDGALDAEAEVITKSGRRRHVQITASVASVRGERVIQGVFRDITERKRAADALRRLNEQLKKEQREINALNRSLEEKVKERTQELRLANEELRERNRQLLDARAQATTDALTGLRNHRAFHERVREEVRLALDADSPVGLIMMDVDNFKHVNDSLGHLAGDQVLRDLALTIAEVIRREDAYRYGGDEFAILLPGVRSEKIAGIAERLRRAVETQANGSNDNITVSLGVACFPETATSAEQLLYGADAAMYWAKSGGKNRVGDWSDLLTNRRAGSLPWYATDPSVKALDVVAALGAALAAKDPTTAAHTQRCSWYTAKLAEELGLPVEQTSVVRLASLLHDIGKLAVPDEVLLKPGPLNEDEWAKMKRHPSDALHVLSHIRSLTDATPAILHHHEHFDGSGYPDGLAGEDIPIASRILLVTDAFDAMTTDRPYRKAMSVEEAIEELRRNKGSQFDPAVVDAFLTLLAREGPQPLRRKTAIRVGSTAAKAGPSTAGSAAGGPVTAP